MAAPRAGGLPAASGIVLAGGASTRFGRDKLSEPVRGRPLVHWPILALATVCTEVLVVVGPRGDAPPLPSASEVPVPIRVIRDPEPLGGPLLGLLTGLEYAAEPLALVVAGDMPSIVPEVLAALLRAVAAGEHGAAALALRGGREPLPSAMRTGAATAAARALLADDERRLGAVLDGVGLRLLDEAEWRPLDPAAVSLRDVDRPGDLEPGDLEPGDLEPDDLRA